MTRYCLLPMLTLLLSCWSTTARLGIWPGDRLSGYAEAPANAYWRRATVTTSHEKGYAGGHGGGTTFHTITVDLRLYRPGAENQEFILEKGTLPLTSESEYIYGLVSRDYNLRFSPDGTKLAITYDGKVYGYVALDTKSRAILFHRERPFHPPAGEGFWKEFPPLEEYAAMLLADLQFTKDERFRTAGYKEEPPAFRTIDSASEDGVVELTDRFLQDYQVNEKIYMAALKGALEVSRNFPLTKERLEFLMRFYPQYPQARPLIHKYLGQQNLGVNAVSYAAMILSAAPDKSDQKLLAESLLRFTQEMENSDSNYRVYHNWDFNPMLWAIAAHAHKLPLSNPGLTAALQRVLSIHRDDLIYDVHPAQVYAIQALTSYRVKPQVKMLDKEIENTETLPKVWPSEYRDPHKDYCEWQEQYSDCKRYPLSLWLDASLKK
ncbi:MAG: hypothetical protein JNM27_23230 [Leptospirales bacterium]|nr:hypothetical protein [Leptospirales bacterium]